MSSARSFFGSLAASALVAAALVAAACGDTLAPIGDGPGGGDAAAGDGAAAPVATAESGTVYLGQKVKIDGAAGALAFAWSVKSAPEGSAVTTATLTGATTSGVSFTADAVGDYVVTLTVTTSDGLAASTDATVTAVDPPVFYWTSKLEDGPAPHKSRLFVVGASGAGATPVACYENASASYADGNADAASFGTDWWEAPPGQPSKVAMVYELRTGGTPTRVLQATTSDNADCATQPITLDTFGPAAVRDLAQPKISPNGSRVAYVRNNATGTRIASVGFDGSKREIAPWFAHADGSPDPGRVIPDTNMLIRRPVWIDDVTVAWVQELAAGSWRIVAAADAEGSAPTVIMSCTGDPPLQFDLLTSGEVIVAQGTGTGTAAVRNLLAYAIAPDTKGCQAPRNLSQLTSAQGGSIVADFSLSPDKSLAGYIAITDPEPKRQELVVVPVDGSAGPRAVVPPLARAYKGPRWIGGGTFLAWGIEGDALTPPTAGKAVAIAPVEGGPVRALATTPANGAVEAIGNGCSFARRPARGSVVLLAGLGALASLRVVRRRRRRSTE